MGFITFQLRNLVTLLEIIITNCTGWFSSHCPWIELSSLEFINNLTNLTFVLKLSWSTSHGVTNLAVDNWTANEEQAKEKQDECTKEEENDHEYKPARCIRVVLTIIVVVEVNYIAPDSQSSISKEKYGD